MGIAELDDDGKELGGNVEPPPASLKLRRSGRRQGRQVLEVGEEEWESHGLISGSRPTRSLADSIDAVTSRA